MPMPKLFLIQTVTPNAFATGRDPKHASVAVTSGLLEIMDGAELKGVLAHELSHVKNRDTLVMTIAAAIAGAVMWLANMARWGLFWGPRGGREDRRGSSNALQMIVLLAVVILAPLAAILIQLAISRTREYGADESGARLAGTPSGLASALEKLDEAVRHRPMPGVNPATAHLFIVNPLSADTITQLFFTHPPVKERVRRLQMLAS
jgi:heat shock protein HtpX